MDKTITKDEVIYELRNLINSNKVNSYGGRVYSYYFGGTLDYSTREEMLNDFDKKVDLPLKEWPNWMKTGFNQTKTSIRNQKRTKSAEFINQVTNGQLQELLKNYGFSIHRFNDNRFEIRVNLTKTLEIMYNAVKNKIESELGVYNVKIRKRATINSANVLDFTDATFDDPVSEKNRELIKEIDAVDEKLQQLRTELSNGKEFDTDKYQKLLDIKSNLFKCTEL